MSVSVSSASGASAGLPLRLATGIQLMLMGIATVMLVLGWSLDDMDAAASIVGPVLLAAATAVALWRARRPEGAWPLLVIPLIDIVALVVLRSAVPHSGFGALLVLPLSWLAAVFGRRGALLGPAVAISLLWITDLALGRGRDSREMLELGALTLVLVATSAMVFLWQERERRYRDEAARNVVQLASAIDLSRRRRQLLVEVLDTVSFCVLTVDAEGRPRRANGAAVRLAQQLGLREPESVAEFPVRGPDRQTPVQPAELPYARALAGETVEDQLIWMGRPEGPQVALSVSARLLASRRGSPRVLLVGRDVTSELRAISARDDLIASVAHELRTPLTSVMGYIDLALDEPGLPPTAADNLEIAVKNVERLTTLLAEIDVVSGEGDSRAMDTRFAPCDLSAVAADAVVAIRPLVADQALSLDVRLREPLPLVADAHRLRQVIDNLLSNAVKYNSVKGTITVITDTSTDADGVARALVSVQDTGRGMTEAEQAGLFSRFYRAESVRGSSVHGMGLGLSITRDIVDLHGGTIEVESRRGEGTAITVVLPCLPPGAEPQDS